MDVVHPGKTQEPREEKYLLLSLEGKLLGPELSRIRSEMALPLEGLECELPQDLPSGYLCRQRRSLPSFPVPSRAQAPSELRSSSDLLCAGRFPEGLSSLVPGMQLSVSPPTRANPKASPQSTPGMRRTPGMRGQSSPGGQGVQ